MCTRDGGISLRYSRRSFLKSAAAGGIVSVAVPLSLSDLLCGGAEAAGATIKATHGYGLCNMGLFLAKERHLAEQAGVDLQFVPTPSLTEMTTMLGAGLVDVSLLPYSNFMTLYDAGAPVRIIAGGGVEGCIIVAKEGINEPRDLKGKTFGTFQADTLEVMPYDFLKSHGLSFRDVQIKYLNTSPELAQAYIAGAVDAICHVEPYATQCLQGRPGSKVLSDGTDVYGKGYADCVLAARSQLIKDRPEAAKGIVKAMMLAQYQCEQDRAKAVSDTVGVYFKTSLEAVMVASKKQPLVVDQRNQEAFIIERGQTMRELGYVKNIPDRKVFDWSILEAVIAENKDIYDQLKMKSA